jgi:CDP-diacylglycerol---serine O-phosphatidyltransferase
MLNSIPQPPPRITNYRLVKAYGQIFDLANIVTLFGLLCGLWAIAIANQSAKGAMLGLMLAGVADGLDGWIARRQERTAWQQAIGAQLDSFVDLCCFGWVPVVILALLGWRQPVDYAVMTLYLICAVLRLAIFNCIGLQTSAQRQYFTGLPITSISLILPIAWLSSQLIAATWLQELWLMGVLGLVAMLMIAPLYIPKPQGILAKLIAAISGLVGLTYLLIL